MTITFYTTSADVKFVPKVLEDETVLTGSLRGTADILNPVLEVTSTVPLNSNYCYIEEFNRFYFCSIEVIRTGLYRVSCKVDVLQSYYNQFKTIPCIIRRNTYVFNSYVPDDKRRFYQYTLPQYITIGEPLGHPTELLMVTVG